MCGWPNDSTNVGLSGSHMRVGGHSCHTEGMPQEGSGKSTNQVDFQFVEN